MKEVVNDFLFDTNIMEEYPTTTECALPPTNCNDCVQKKVGLAQAYIPVQGYETQFSQERGLVCGTAFPSLAMPYTQGMHLKQYAKEGSAWNKK